jgi:hypothetical protein
LADTGCVNEIMLTSCLIYKYTTRKSTVSVVLTWISNTLFGFKQVCSFREKDFYSYSHHSQLALPIHTKNIYIVRDHPIIIHVPLGFNLFSSI